MRRLSIVLGLLAAVAYAQSTTSLCTGPYGDFDLPVPADPLTIDQVVPENPILDAPYQWQLNLCSKKAYSPCPNIPDSFIVEIKPKQNDVCLVGFTSATGVNFVEKYGGLNMIYQGTVGGSLNRAANVTLKCNPNANTLTSAGPIVAHSSQQGADWTFDIVLETNVKGVCKTAPPAPPSPAPASSGIIVSEFFTPNCGGQADVNQTFAAGSCTAQSDSTALLRFCATSADGSTAMRTQYFGNSSTCLGMPSFTDTFRVGECVPTAGGNSFIVESCN